MLFRLVSSVKRKGSLNRQFVQRIPADVRPRVTGAKLYIPVGNTIVPLVLSPSAQSVRVSLRTAEVSEAKIRQAQVAAYLESYWEDLRKNRPIALTNREAAALGGELYRSWAEEERSTKQASVTFNPDGTTTYEEGMEHDVPEEWDAILERIEINRETADIDALESMLGPIADRLLSRKGIFVLEASSRLVVLNALFDGLRDAFRNRRRNAAGDYSPDINAQRFPEWPSKAPTADLIRVNPNSSTNSLTALVEDWWTEAKAAGRTLSTYESYKATFTRFSQFLGHDDCTRVTVKDVLAYKDYRLKQGVSPKTVGASDIAGLRSVFGWAVANLRVPLNPASNVKVARSKAIRTRQKEFTLEEAKAILAHSLNHKQGRESHKVYLAKRWVPWLCAYSGARVGEIVQLRRQDVRFDGEICIIIITPEAGTVKDKEVREVVIHPHLIAMGFKQFVTSAKHGYLFLTPNAEGEIRGVWRSVKNRLTEFVREVLQDPEVAPNHGWRHMFKSRGRDAGIADSILDSICGHAPASIGGSYGSVSLKAQTEAIYKFPRFVIAQSGSGE